MNEDLYPNDGTYFGVPVEPHEQKISRQQERAKVLEAKAEIEKVIAHFQERIDFRNSIDSITTSLDQDPALHQKIMEVNKLLKQELEIEKIKLEELLEVHAKHL